MQDLSREAILRMVGLHDAAHLSRQLNAIQLAMEEQDGKLVTYWTEIRKDERQITLVAGRVSANETSIGQLQVTATSLTASVSSLNTTVNGDGTQGSGLVSQVSSLSLTVGSINLSVQSLSTTVNGDGTQGSGLVSRVSSLELTESSISQRVSVIEGDYVKEAEISLMVKKDGNGYISNASIKADNIDFTFTRSTNFISNGTTVMNINSSGDLWILGDYKGGSITGNITIGTGTNKMYIRPNEADGAELVGFNGNTQLIELGFYSVSGGGSSTYLVLGEKAAYLSKWVELKWEGLKFGGGPYYGMHPTTYKVKIGGTWPTAASQVDVGEVYLDNGYLKVRTS
jgi:hypothetical protein